MADTLLSSANFLAGIGSNTTKYIPIGTGGLSSHSTEAPIERTWRNSGTLKNLLVLIQANSILVLDTVITLRKNQADTSQTVSVPAGSTGTFEDTSNNVTTATTDEFDYKVVVPTTASGTISIRAISNTYTADSNTYANLQTSVIDVDSSSVVYDDNTTRYASLCGHLTNQSTESNTQITFKTGGTLKNGFVHVTQNNVSSASTVITRKNATSDGNVSISITGNTTGIFEDASNTDTVTTDDEWNWKIVCPSVSGNRTIAIRNIQIGFETTNSEFPITSSITTPLSTAFNATENIPIGTSQGTTIDISIKSRIAFTAKNMVASVTANTITTSATTFSFRKSGSSVITISVSAGATGIFENTSDTSAVATSDTINFQIVTPNTSGSISYRQVSVIAVGKTTVTKTHTTDATIKKTLTRTHTTDSTIKKAITKTHTTDAFIKNQITKTHTTDATVKKSLTLSHTTDATVKKSLSLTHTTDATIKDSFTKTHTTDSTIKKTLSLTHTTDSTVKKSLTVSHNTDAYLSSGVTTVTLTHSTDAYLILQPTVSHTTDSLILKQQTVSHTTDAIVKKSLTKDHTTDSTIKKSLTVSHNTDSTIKKSLTVSHSTDAFIKKPSTLDHTTDATIKKSLTKDHTTDSLILKQQTLSHTTDSTVKKSLTKTHTTDAYLSDGLTTVTLTHTTDAFISRPQTGGGSKRKPKIQVRRPPLLIRRKIKFTISLFTKESVSYSIGTFRKISEKARITVFRKIKENTIIIPIHRIKESCTVKIYGKIRESIRIKVYERTERLKTLFRISRYIDDLDN